MTSLPSKILLVVLVPVALGGCSSLFGERFASNRQVERQNSQIRQGQGKPVTTSSATEAGRTMLSAGQPGKAIEAFQRALASGEPLAPALNGMGVAYARIGRTDLAVRYFRQASATEPLNSQFAQNLDRILRLRSSEAEQVQHAARSPLVETPSTSSIRSQAIASDNSRRTARSEIRIVTNADPASTGRGQVSLASRFQPLVRIEFAQAPASEVMQRGIVVAASFKPIVRVNLDEAGRSNLPKVQVAIANSKPTR